MEARTKCRIIKKINGQANKLIVKIVSWWDGGGVETETGKRFGTGWWDGILGDFCRAWLATSRPLTPTPPKPQQGSVPYWNQQAHAFTILHTHAHMRKWNMNVWMLWRSSHALTQARSYVAHAESLHMNVYPQFMIYKYWVANIISDAWLLIRDYCLRVSEMELAWQGIFAYFFLHSCQTE